MSRIDVEIINPFLNSMSNVLVTMAMLDPVAGEVSLKEEDIAWGDISGVIGLSGEHFKGSMAVTFTKPVILEIAARMLGETLTEIDQTITDLVGEITNMVTGGAKNLLSQKGYDVGLATPVVITGENHKVMHQASGQKIIIPFSVEVGEFFVEVCFERI